MKRLLFILTLASFLFITDHTLTADEKTEILIQYTYPTTRSIASYHPKAYIQHDILSLFAENGGIYSFSIENNLGETHFSSTFTADGAEYDFCISSIGNGLFRLIIKGNGNVYEGLFNIFA